MEAPHRVFRTASGHKFEHDLADGEVAFLAYPQGRKLPFPVGRELGILDDDNQPIKNDPPAGDKMAAPSGNKGFQSANVRRCDVDGCGFTTESDRGLSIHATAKHG